MEVAIIGSNGFVGQSLALSLQEYELKKISLRKEDWQNEIRSSIVLINLVGKAHDHKGTATEKDFHFVNVELVQEIFEVFKNSDAKLLIHISSLAALEELESDLPLNEEEDCRPISWYGKSKREAETWLLAQKLPLEKKIVVIRPPMIHGLGDKGNLGLLYKLISKGIPYPLGSFNNSRSFISTENFNFFIKEIINKSEKITSGIYHIADDETISTNEIIQIIKEIEQKKIINLKLPKSLIYGAAKIGDFIPIPLNSIRLKKLTSDLQVSNQKIKSLLNISTLPLTAKEGIIKTIKSFKK
jgi:nucleoside-diphosphate-sugar epimerase